MKPADQVPKVTVFQPVAAGSLSPGHPAGLRHLVPIALTRYPTPEEERERAFELHHDLIGALERNGLKGRASRLAKCGVSRTSLTWGRDHRRRVLGCHAGYCPVCLWLRRNRIFSAMRPWVLEGMGKQGGSAHLVLSLPAPAPGDSVLERLDRVAGEVRTAKTPAVWRKRFTHEVGVVMNTEVGPGGELQGHPHVHLFVYSSRSECLEAFVRWLEDRWRRRCQIDLIEGCETTILGIDPNAWAPRLRYVLKGTELDPAWPKELLREVVEAVSSRRRLFSPWGLAVRPGGWTKARPAGNIVPFRSVAASRIRSTG